MNQQNQPELPAKIYAEAVVHSVSGASLLNAPDPVTKDNVEQFHASDDRIKVAVQRLRNAGFEVLGSGKMSITIAAAPEVYERSLQTTLEAVERPVIKELGKADTATFLNAVDDKPFGEIDVSRTEWHQLLDGIVINEPIYYFRDGLPSATPPKTSNKYLSVTPPKTSNKYLPVLEELDEGLAQGLNATLAHDQEIKGKGVKVAMVDSGWYRHPFFTQNHYKVNVVLAPGSSNAEQDDSGHGTGESANLFAIAPDVTLTVVKADVALAGGTGNVNSISAFRTAVALQPDIISCSWGSDQRGCNLSPYNCLLAATVAEAVRQGMIVVFSAGNGHYGFPAQHPDVIAAGGVYRHLSGSLRGKLEASNYASSFISPIYPGRRVPDVCGLVGELPHGSYIMLPVPPGSGIDQALASDKDGTEPTDGWAAFSGTSAAAPQLAGICALLKQVKPQLSPAQAKQILQQTARDVAEGFSNRSSSGESARAGLDLATGSGLADAYAAVQAVQAVTRGKCCDECTSQVQSFSNLNSTLNRRQPMPSQFPKLQKKLDELLWKFEQELQDTIGKYDLEDVELKISEANFISRTPVTKSAHYLRTILDECWDESKGKIKQSDQIDEEHISAAQGLLKLGRYQSTAIDVLRKS